MKGKEKGNDCIMNYIKKAVIISLFTTLAVMIRPCTAKAEDLGAFTVTGDTSHYGYDEGTHLLTITGDCTVKNTTQGTTSDHIVITNIANDCTVTLAGVNIESSSAAPILIDIDSDKTVTLKLSGTNTVKTLGGDYAGIEKNGDDSGSLIITGDDNGVLNADNSGNGAGIGGGYQKNGSNITISGGNVTVISNIGAGIGGGESGSGSDITISGGNVSATGHVGAGIGGGYQKNGSDIT